MLRRSILTRASALVAAAATLGAVALAPTSRANAAQTFHNTFQGPFA